MRIARLSCLLLSAALLPGALTAPAAAQEDESPTLTRYETFLLQLHNGLVRQGALPGEEIADAKTFWEKADAERLAEALAEKLGQGGGMVTPEQVLPAETPFEIRVEGDNTLYLAVEEGVSYPVEPRQGLVDCALKEVEKEMPGQRLAVGANLQCLFAQKVRDAYLASGESGGPVSPELIEKSKAAEALEEHLLQLQEKEIVVSYSLDGLKDGSVSFKLAEESGDPLPLPLPLSLASPFATVEEEVEEAVRLTGSLLETHLFSLAEDGTELYPRADLDQGLRAMAQAKTASERREVFFSAAGLAALFPRLRPVPCTYGTGVVTPCNRDFAVLWGADAGRAFRRGSEGFKEFQATLSGFGYRKHDINAQCRFSPGDERQLSALRSAQTLIFNVHGGQGGFTDWQCYPGVQALEERGPSRECCEALKRTAEALGLPGAGGIDCSVPADQRRWETPGGELRIDSTYGGSCPCGSGGPNRCRILGTNGVLTGLGNKAAVFTAQCYGGQCAGGAPNLGGAVMDFLGQTVFSNLSPPERCDDKRISQDLRGEATYCRDTTPAPPDREPWRGPATGQCTGGPAIGLMPGAPSTLRTVQGSLETRGAWGVNGLVTACRTEYNANGWTQFNAASLGGSPHTQVEFAPAMGTFYFWDWYGEVTAAFTSALKPGCRVDVELSGGARKTISTNPVATAAVCDPAGVFVRLSGDPAWMSESAWGQPPEQLRAFYGADQSNWPWYIKIKISNATAPNGAPLVGNQGATKKWIWASPLDPSPVPPHLHSSGMFPQGGNVYEVWIPVVPSTACCMPNIEWSYPPGGGAPSPRQNGCTCAGGVGKDFCFVGTCVMCDAEGFCFPWAYPGMAQADCPGTYSRFNGSWHLWHDCCPVAVNGTNVCEQTLVETIEPPATCEPGQTFPISRTRYQHIARPWDQNGPQQCPVIEGIGGCYEH